MTLAVAHPVLRQVTQEAGLAPKWAGRRLEGEGNEGEGEENERGQEDEKEKQEENDGF